MRTVAALLALSAALAAAAEDPAPPLPSPLAAEDPAPPLPSPLAAEDPAPPPPSPLAATGRARRPDAAAVEEIDVVGHRRDELGTAASASAGTIGADAIEARPLLRPGDVEELVPGMIVTQHSGDGKANQYFLRGFNLDHGTDFAITVEGIPVNLPSNAHGQGYADLNFLIPELVGHADYVKGPYDASRGDFSSAGAEDLFYVADLPRPLLQVTTGSFGYERALAAASPRLGGGTLLAAVELLHQDGPWVVPEDFRKVNGVLRWSRDAGDGTLVLEAQGYGGSWTATDQIPLRAVLDGAIGRFGTENPTDGGSSHRASLSASWDGAVADGNLTATAYLVRSDLTLFSDFTYFLDDPVNGDQIEQTERRVFGGTSGTWRAAGALAGLPQVWRAGWEARTDRIDPDGLLHTVDRRVIGTWSLDRVLESSGALWGDVDTTCTPWLRILLGLRALADRFEVAASDPRNSGTTAAGLLLPKATAVLGPWGGTELFANFGDGYHSNDARGVEATVDARSGLPIPRATPLVRSQGAEAGVRTEALPGVQASLDLWLLDLGSELVWDADQGTAVPAGPTRRIGIEGSVRWRPLRWLVASVDGALSRARFTRADPAGQDVPEAVGAVGSASAAVEELGPWSGSVALRSFGPRALTQDGSVRSPSSTLVDCQLTYRVTRWLAVSADLFNALGAQADDIDYFYTSRLRGEPAAGVADLHLHPAEPRSLRVTLAVTP